METLAFRAAALALQVRPNAHLEELLHNPSLESAILAIEASESVRQTPDFYIACTVEEAIMAALPDDNCPHGMLSAPEYHTMCAVSCCQTAISHHVADVVEAACHENEVDKWRTKELVHEWMGAASATVADSLAGV